MTKEILEMNVREDDDVAVRVFENEDNGVDEEDGDVEVLPLLLLAKDM